MNFFDNDVWDICGYRGQAYPLANLMIRDLVGLFYARLTVIGLLPKTAYGPKVTLGHYYKGCYYQLLDHRCRCIQTVDAIAFNIP